MTRQVTTEWERLVFGEVRDGQFLKRSGHMLVGSDVEGGAGGPHAHPISEVTDLQSTLDGKADGTHGHAVSDVTGLQAALDSKGTSNFSGSYPDLTNKPTLFDGAYSSLSGIPATFAPEAHNQAISTITGLQAALDGKQASGSYASSTHNHDAAYEAFGAVATHAAAADPHTGYQKESEKGVANGYASLGADGKVPSAQLPASQGGSDPWTYVKLGADFTTSSSTAVDAGLAFTPAANTSYVFEATLLTRTATATVGPRPGIAWPTGMTDGVTAIQQSSSATANVFANGNISGAVLAPVGGVPTTTGSWPAFVWGNVIAGASPSGTVKVQLASETAGTNVTIKAGSYLRYRSY